MATKTIVEMVDDVDGSPAEESVQFSLDGVTYEIDLSQPNAMRLREGLEPFRAASRRTGGRVTKARTITAPPAPASAPPASTSITSASFTKADRTAMRLWAKRNGITVGKIGRIPRSVELGWLGDGRPAS